MAVTSGFFNSLNHDRRYNAEQMSSLFEGIINDGIFETIGGTFVVSADTGNRIKVATGKAWFNKTWTLNDTILFIEAEESEVVLNRYDAVVIEVDTTETVRNNSIKIIKGSPSSEATKPEMIKSEHLNQYPLAYIFRGANTEEIIDSNIENMVGSDECPFITGLMQTVSIDTLLGQWKDGLNRFMESQYDEFSEWFNEIKGQLSEDVAGHLQSEIDNIKTSIDIFTDKILTFDNPNVKEITKMDEPIGGSDYSYMIALDCPGVTEKHSALVSMDPSMVASEMFASFATMGANTVYIYASENPTILTVGESSNCTLICTKIK